MNQLTLLTTGIKQEELSCTALGDGVAIPRAHSSISEPSGYALTQPPPFLNNHWLLGTHACRYH